MASISEKIRIRSARNRLKRAEADLKRASSTDESGQLETLLAEAQAAVEYAQMRLNEVMRDLDMKN